MAQSKIRNPESKIEWPSLPYKEWKDTYVTLHMWTQVVGKVALACAPPLNHSWQVALQITARGFSTYSLPYGSRLFSIEFDFIDHQLHIQTSDGASNSIALRPMTVADFYVEAMETLREMGLPVKIWPMAVEIPDPIRLDSDLGHRSYVPEQANRCWRILGLVQKVLLSARCGFIGKASPAHFFWGSFDLALSRFSGRPAPPREGPAFMQEAYSHEVISHGFWPGNELVPEPVFYMYCVPEPHGFREAKVRPAEAYFHPEFNELVLPYEAVRTASNPEAALCDFIGSTYDVAADLAGWDRQALERATPAPPVRT